MKEMPLKEILDIALEAIVAGTFLILVAFMGSVALSILIHGIGCG
jgi:hypothetical protein